MLKPASDKSDKFNALKLICFEAPPVLNSAREIQTLAGSNKLPDSKHLGRQFNSEVYFCMSQANLDSRILELVANEDKVGDIVLAPSFLIKELWDDPLASDESVRNFHHFYNLSLANLSE